MIGFKIEKAMPVLFVNVKPGQGCAIQTQQQGSKFNNQYTFRSNIEAMFFVIELANDWDLIITLPMHDEWIAFCELRRYNFSVKTEQLLLELH